MSHLHIVLASQSPRRRELLELMQIPFSTVPAAIDEQFDPELTVEENVMAVAEQKARYSAMKIDIDLRESVILGADTTVVLGETSLGKPRSFDDAGGMLAKLQGKTHEVKTGFALLEGNRCHKDCVTTRVTFSPMTEQEIKQYIETQQPFDKAGGYGIQDPFISCFIQRIEGCYYNVVGLPLSQIYSVLCRIGRI